MVPGDGLKIALRISANCLNYHFLAFVVHFSEPYLLGFLLFAIVYIDAYIFGSQTNRRVSSLIEISILIITISALSALPVIGLAGFHIGLVAMGRTTNEQVITFNISALKGLPSYFYG